MWANTSRVQAVFLTFLLCVFVGLPKQWNWPCMRLPQAGDTSGTWWILGVVPSVGRKALGQVWPSTFTYYPNRKKHCLYKERFEIAEYYEYRSLLNANARQDQLVRLWKEDRSFKSPDYLWKCEWEYVHPFPSATTGACKQTVTRGLQWPAAAAAKCAARTCWNSHHHHHKKNLYIFPYDFGLFCYFCLPIGYYYSLSLPKKLSCKKSTKSSLTG